MSCDPEIPLTAPMRLAYFSSSTIPSREANSVHVMKMCQALSRQGHDVLLAAIAGDSATGDDFARYGVEPCFELIRHGVRGRAPTSRIGYAFAAPKLVRRAGRLPDLVYGRHLPSISVAARWSVPVIFESHQAPCAIERFFERRLFARPNFARLVVISEALRGEYRRLHPQVPARRILVAPDAADPPPDVPADVAAAIRRSPDRLQVGYVGHLYPGKGIEVVLDLARRLPEVDFHVVGGTDSDLAAVQSRANGSGNLVFHGYVPAVDTEAYRRAMDVLLAPYQHRVHAAGGRAEIGRWMSPLKIFEYMASRRPMIASDLPVLREVITDGETGLLAPPADLDAWVGAVQRLRDPALRTRLAERASTVWRERHTWSRRAEHVLAELDTANGSGQ